MHYSRLKRHGDPATVLHRRYNGGPCSIEGCSNRAAENGMCEMHMMRVRRYGDPNYVTPESVRRERSRDAQPTLRKAKPTSYLKLLGRHEHRVVAEKMLGRKLKRGEIVHHRDGNRHNNAPENLEVMTQSQHIKEHRPEMHAARMARRGK